MKLATRDFHRVAIERLIKMEVLLTSTHRVNDRVILFEKFD